MARRLTAHHGPAARSLWPAMAPRPRGPVLIFQSFLSSGKSTLMYRSAFSSTMQLLYCAISFCLSQHHKTNRNKDSERIQTRGPLYAQTRCRSVHARGFVAGQKTVENQDWASGPSQAISCGLLGLRAAGLWQAMGCWAAGLLLAKPMYNFKE